MADAAHFLPTSSVIHRAWPCSMHSGRVLDLRLASVSSWIRSSAAGALHPRIRLPSGLHVISMSPYASDYGPPPHIDILLIWSALQAVAQSCHALRPNLPSSGLVKTDRRSFCLMSLDNDDAIIDCGIDICIAMHTSQASHADKK